jgi:hypothetical protein
MQRTQMYVSLPELQWTVNGANLAEQHCSYRNNIFEKRDFNDICALHSRSEMEKIVRYLYKPVRRL